MSENNSGQALVRVDLHTHTAFSGDADTLVGEWVEAVQSRGLYAAAVTDHHQIEGALRCKELFKGTIVGEEILTAEGEIIGLFLTEKIGRSANAEELCKALKDKGAVVYVPHPGISSRKGLSLERLRELCLKNLVDVVEAASSKARQRLDWEIASELKRMRIALGAGSDAHTAQALGTTHVLMRPFSNRDDFLEALLEGSIHHEFFDPPKPFRAKILP